MTAALHLSLPLRFQDAIEVRHGQLIRAFGAAEGTLLLVLEEECRRSGAAAGEWLHISSARWIQQAARLSGGRLPFPRNRLRHHLSALTRKRVIERRYLRRREGFEFRLNREALAKKLEEQRQGDQK
ncbi:hypothetical protein Deipr_2474 (plasmid) [Deinococcus proteolyticus MRP]|uniref:Uncharacterized protein n=1 Tax=Deinococcus proteolyticus (strain ATCC 35074 / DSM 20540 / JCM 6276 / NBRC 101906 / NCIMB 13154 / VKM Ac-1939 / CCM 2703 / MRP) TaxID=693977 RepID=F0RQN2_DEIPM|nr:hypothetical protein [Deinococcus proteolyticus]ADY27591.1 hypothetical protein Deipr_2474 [Deinococcus proteolyticus MRP]